MNKRFLPLSILAIGVAFAACNNEAKVQEEAAAEEHHGIVVENMDNNVRPQDDFFRYVNGTWYDNVDMPADQGSWGAFNELREDNNETVLRVLEEASQSGKYADGTDQKKAADYYAVGMDSARAEAMKFAPFADSSGSRIIHEIRSNGDLDTVLHDTGPGSGNRRPHGQPDSGAPDPDHHSFARFMLDIICLRQGATCFYDFNFEFLKF